MTIREKTLVVIIFTVCSLLYSSDSSKELFEHTAVKIQLDETFEFIGSDDYDTEYDTTGLSGIFKDHIYDYLKNSYGLDIVASRLREKIGEDISDQEYVYVRGNISRIKSVQYVAGGTIDLRTSKEMESDKSPSGKRYGSKENIFSVTAGLDFFNLGTGENYFNIVYTIVTKMKTSIDAEIHNSEINKIYNDSAKELFALLIEYVSRHYIPGLKFAEIVEKYENNGWIINKGFTSGFDVGKFVIPISDKRSKFRIIESSPKYSLIAPFPKRDIELKPQEKLKLFGNQISNSGMPKILVMPVEFCYSMLFDKNIDYDRSTITQWFKDHLNSIAKLDIVPAQGSLFKSQRDAAYYGTVATEDLIGNMTRPDYLAFPKITYAFQEIYEGEESLGFKTSVTTLRVGISVDFVDLESGIVLHSETHEEFREEKLAENLAYVNTIDRFPSLVKDGIYSLSEKVAKSFNTEYIEGALGADKGNKFPVAYESNAVFKDGQILPFYRTAKEYKNIKGEKVGVLELKKGMVRILNESPGKTIAVPLGSTKPMKGDIIRGYSVPRKISRNIVYIKNVITKSKTESQLPLDKIIIYNNIIPNISKSYNLSLIADETQKAQIYKIQDYLNFGFYTIKGQSPGYLAEPSGYLEIISAVLKKDKIHDTRIDIQYATQIKLFDLDNSQLLKETKAQHIIIGDDSPAKSKKKKRKKKNIVVKGMSKKDIDYKLLELNNAYIKELLSMPSVNAINLN